MTGVPHGEQLRASARPASSRARARLPRAVRLCLYLAVANLRSRHAGSVGGMAWALVAPMMTIGIIWLALDRGLGLHRTLGGDYGLSLVVGLAAWLYFADGVNTSVSSITGNPHLVKKVVFPVLALPVSQALASLLVHAAVVALLIVLLAFSGHPPGPSLLALPAWMLASFVLTAMVGALLAGLNVVLRDVAAVVPSLVQIGLWVTPVIWPLSAVPASWQPLVLMNPMAVVVNGYRAALLGVASPGPVAVTGFALGLGAFSVFTVWLFRRVAAEFADAL